MSPYGYLREDDDGHWYLIPENKLEMFYAMNDAVRTSLYGSDEWDAACENMIDEFNKYRLSGGPYDLRIEIKEGL